MNPEVKLTGVEDLVRTLNRAIKNIDDSTVEGLEAGGEVLRQEMEASDHLDLAHGSFVVETRREQRQAAVGPSKEGKRGHVVRFHEFGTVHLPARGLMRKAVERSIKPTTKAIARAFARRMARR